MVVRKSIFFFTTRASARHKWFDVRRSQKSKAQQSTILEVVAPVRTSSARIKISLGSSGGLNCV